MEKSLSVIPVAFDRVRSMLMRAITRGDTTQGAASLEDICAGGQPFAVLGEGGQPVAAYVLALRDHAHGTVCWVMAAGGGLVGHDLTGEVMGTIEVQAMKAQAQQVAITTRRRGLIRKLKAQGYSVTGVTLRKNIQ